jgi:hypothetical protein
MPFIKSMAPYALRAGVDVMESVAKGKSWKNSAVTQVAKRIPWTHELEKPFSWSTQSYRDDSGPPRKRKKEEQTGNGARKRNSVKGTKRVKHDIFS